MSTPTSPPQSSSATATRRVPPPCWSKEETLALIEAYKEKWFALRRGNLKALDWDAVSTAVTSAADPGTTKSSVQCRHKIEKLRKRYRAEKQRSLKNPGKFSSSWDLFPLLDSMSFASTSVAGSDDQDHTLDSKVSLFDGFGLKLKNREWIDGNSGSNLGFDHDFRGGFGSNFDFDHKFEGRYAVKLQGNRDFVAKGIKFKSNGRIGDGYGSMVDFDHNFVEGVDSVGEFPLKTLGDRNFVNPEFKPKNFGGPSLNYDYYNDLEEYGIDEGMGFLGKVSSAWDSVPQGFHPKKCGRVDRTTDVDCRGLNGFASSSSRPGLGRKNGGVGGKKGVDPVEEMVSSIKLLAEGFVRMEKMKMEMVKEIEKMRMEMEMKHNEMILESQQKIVDAFAKALLEKKKRKKKPSVLSPNVNGNGVEEWQSGDMVKKKKVDIVSPDVQMV